MSEQMDYYRAVDVLSDMVYRRGSPEEARAFLAVIEEVRRLRGEVDELTQLLS